MALVKVRAGSVRNVAGAPLVGKTATLKNHATDAPIAAGTTDGTGAYSFTGIDETIRTRVEVAFGGGSAQMHVNAPISPDLDHAYINSSLRSAVAATVAFGGAVGVGGVLTVTGVATLAGSATVAGTLTVQGTGETIVGVRDAGNPVYVRTRSSRGTIAAPTVSAGGDVVRIDIASAYTNGAWQDVGRSAYGIFAAQGGLAGGDWWLDLTDGVGAMQRRLGMTGVGAFTVSGTATVTGATALNGGVGVTGSSTLNGPVAVGGGLTVQSGGILVSAGLTTLQALTVNGITTLPAGGSTAAPTLTFAGDPDTGIYRPGDGAVGLVTNGALRLLAEPGTVIVAGPLTVSGAIDAQGDLTVGDDVEIAGSLNHAGIALGFFGARERVKRSVTGAKAGNAALASVIAALVDYGLVLDGTSA